MIGKHTLQSDSLSTKKSSRQHLFEGIESLMELFPKECNIFLSGTESGYLRYFISKKHPNLILTIDLEGINSDKAHFTIAIELARTALKNKESYKQITFTKEERAIGILQDDFYHSTNRILSYFACATYYPTTTELANFTLYLHQVLTTQYFYSIFAKLDISMS